MPKKTREEAEAELRELDAKLNDPKEDARINQLVLAEIAERTLSPQAQAASSREFRERFADEVRDEDARTVVRRPTVRKMGAA